MDHYYSSNPTSESKERTIEYTIQNHTIQLITDNGVFSKAHVDFATNFLLQTILSEITGEVLDLGCGYGIIGIVASRMANVTHVTMCDVNTRALDLANRNAMHNKVKNYKVIESDGFTKITKSFDTIITNPPIRAGKEVIYQMYRDSKAHLKPGGKFYLVINKKHGAPSTINYLKELFANVEVMDKKAGFHVIKCY